MEQEPNTEKLSPSERKPYGWAEECATCRLIREEHKGHGPSHAGSPRCESGSLASGGNRAHCACDTCF